MPVRHRPAPTEGEQARARPRAAGPGSARRGLGARPAACAPGRGRHGPTAPRPCARGTSPGAISRARCPPRRASAVPHWAGQTRLPPGRRAWTAATRAHLRLPPAGRPPKRLGACAISATCSSGGHELLEKRSPRAARSAAAASSTCSRLILQLPLVRGSPATAPGEGRRAARIRARG